MNKIKQSVSKYKHAWLFLYGLIYLPWFTFLEKKVNIASDYHIIHMTIDDYIPFCEYFIVPYLLWFLYIAVVVLYFFFTDKSGFYDVCTFLFVGMTVFLIISSVYPNGHALRPATFEDQNIFTQLVQWLYQTDTPTNLFPSIHVYNSIGCHIAVMKSTALKKHPVARGISCVLCCSIVLSTMLLKQHSFFDVLTAFALASFMYYAVYLNEEEEVAMQPTASITEQLRRTF